MALFGIIGGSLAAFVQGCGRHQEDEGYRAEIEKFRQEYETRLKSDNGWLTIAGLFFLGPRKSTFGSDPVNDIVLPEPAPARAGTFEFRNGKVTVTAAGGGRLIINGTPVATAELRSDGKGEPDRITIQDLALWVHDSGERRAIRLRDKNSRLRAEFTGVKWFPVNEAYRVEGRFVPYDEPKTMRIPNILGDVETVHSPGLVVFSIGDQEFKMEPVAEDGDDEFWFIFRDMTSGNDTYAAARFLSTPLPVNGRLVLDFNKAENPPCAYNPYTTCPLPPEQNRLRVRIGAGEKIYEPHF
jgi:uncharacterized protein (DUF1684 family)